VKVYSNLPLGGRNKNDEKKKDVVAQQTENKKDEKNEKKFYYVDFPQDEIDRATDIFELVAKNEQDVFVTIKGEKIA